MNPLESKPDPEAPTSDDPPPISLPGLPPPSTEEPVAEARPVESKPPDPPVEEPPGKDGHKKDKDREKGKDKDKEKEKDKGKNKDKKDKKKKKKEKKEFEKAGPWERYKALLDSVKESQDLVDLADHKARFALLIMGALNAAIILLGTRSDLLSRLPPNLMLGLYSYFGIYAVIAIYFLVQAIESLRPRSIPDVALKEFSERDESLGLRFFVDALRYDTPTYLKAWQSVRISQLNAELATQLHTLARINKAKYNAVAKLYLGLQAITVLTAGLLVALGVAAWVEHRVALPATASVEAAEAQAPKIKGGKPKKGGWAILGEPERFAVAGVREPSGVAFSPGRGTLFVVGDEGSLVEVSTDGTVKANIPTGGNLEDVALHTPSGRLVLLSEKKGELIVLDPATGKKTGKFKLDNEALLGGTGVDKNQGFEGLAFRAESGKPGGGIFYLVHQRQPAVIVAIAFDPLAPSGDVGAAQMVSRAPVGTRDDLTAVTWDSSLDRLFVIADSKDRLAMLSVTGAEEAEIVLPGVQQEGLTFDAEGNLWVADDRAGLLVFRGARQKIAEEMKAPRPELPVADGPPATKPS